MPYPDFQLPQAALATAVRLTGGGDPESLREMLELHAGKLELLDETVIYYRPFYTAAVYRETQDRVKVLGGAADRLEYLLATPESLYRQQAKEDERLALDIPPMYQVNRPGSGRRIFAGVSR